MNDVWHIVLDFMTPLEILNFSLTSKKHNEISNSKYLWDNIFNKRWKNKQISIILNKFGKDTKKNYFIGEKEINRKMITFEETTSFLWLFKFKSEPYNYYYFKFLKDGKLYSEDHPHVSPDWVWYLNPIQYAINCNDFYPHILSRTSV
jgi:hypothetical protein